MKSKKEAQLHALKVILTTTDEIKTFKDIIRFIPKTVLAHAIRNNTNRFSELIEQPYKFKLSELDILAKAIGINIRVLLDLILPKEKPPHARRAPSKT